ncbi:RHO1 GDP-GTP exchange protein 2 [Rhizopus stolonifer]|uniref:RHO1 GDP-GTP exchange protein 2 n=1 Tax=Rhizopus stolonifer TaxID=4846 RepID=A0A367KSF5_RHIST|nr:RHO1 GDP-GTP exchange protein 2 [Rhizopus stolonifer]
MSSSKPQENDQKNDVLYLKRTPTVTYDSASGGPIPESIKKLYVQQQLPVRKQSLAASHQQNKGESYRKKYQQKQQAVPPVRFSSVPPISTVTDSVSIEVEAPTPTSPSRSKRKSSLLPDSKMIKHSDISDSIKEQDKEDSSEEEDDDFDFKDRPPSSIIIPIDPQDDDDDDNSIEEGKRHEEIDDAFTELIESWEGLSPPQSCSSPDSGRRKGSIGDTSSLKTISTQLNKSTESLLQQEPQRDSRLSTDTVLTDISELTMAPTEMSSIFLSKMQQKREEQQKSIDAYRSQHQSSMSVSKALLSEIANELYKTITLSNMTKEGIEYHDVFSGKDVIDRMLAILRINDRLEALEVGTALRSQNFFHDVNYEPVLKDSADELYAFKEMIPNDNDTENSIGHLTQDRPRQSKEEAKDSRLWSQSVPEHVLEVTLPEERKRQECIYELIYTEQDFVRDLQYLHDFWVEPLLTLDIIDDDYKVKFVKEVFYNIADVRHINSELSRALDARQAEKYLVSGIGDVMMEHVRNFEPFIEYGAHQIVGKYMFELEKKRNPVFARFVEETERKPESRRLELNGYLTKPTTRLGRYNLLLREILKKTPDDNPDKELIPKVMDIVAKHLERVNLETGKRENLFNLQQISERLEFKSPADYVDLKLDKPGRQLLMKGRMKRKGNSSSEASDLQVFLFDHYLVLAKIRIEDHVEKYKTYKRPIPLELLSLNTSNNRQKRVSSILPYSRSSNLGSVNNIIPRPSTSDNIASVKPSNSLSFIHHGRKGSPAITLYTTASSIQQIWVKKIIEQKTLLSESHRVFTITPLVRNLFPTTNRVYSTSTIPDEQGDGKRFLIGADQGVFVTKRDPETKTNTISRIISIEKVSQVELMPESQLLVLADKTLWTYSLDVLSSSSSPSTQSKRGRSVSQNTAFFHVGECMSKTLVCVVKTTTLSATTIRVLEPVMMDDKSKKTKSMFILKRLVRSGPVALKAYKDLYLPSEASSINLLKSKMCISSPREIGVVDMKNFGVQALLDPEDEELSFVFNRPDVRPITIYRIQFAEYLVCYNEFAFFVDQRGRYIKSSVRIDWEGAPDSFALSYPYILAFEPEFIEVRNVHTGELEQIIRGRNIRCTSNNTQDAILQGAMDDPDNEGYQLIFQLEKK